MKRVAMVLLMLAALDVRAGGAFRDPTDGQFDMSDWLVTRKGALPIATVITEPAVGFGLGLGLVFFHQSIEESVSRSGGKMAPPSITAGIAARTENGTRAGAVGHFGSWKGDRFRYLEGWGIVQELNVRLGDTDIFAGARYVYGDITGRFDAGESGPPAEDRDVTVGGLAANLNWDSAAFRRCDIRTRSPRWSREKCAGTCAGDGVSSASAGRDESATTSAISEMPARCARGASVSATCLRESSACTPESTSRADPTTARCTSRSATPGGDGVIR